MLRVATIGLAALALAAPAAAQTPQDEPAAVESREAPIVITGLRLDDYRAALAACLARNCPPDQDIDATLALAEAEFIEGEYEAARRTVRASLERNRRHAQSYPEPVSDLYRSSTRIARHMGQDYEARRSAWGILEALQRGIPVEDHRHFTARLEISEMLVAFGNYNVARRELDRLAAVARRAGRENVAVMAEMRGLWIGHMALPSGDSRRRLLQISRETDPSRRLAATAAKIVLARIYREEGQPDRADALLAEVGRGSRGGNRRLIFNPPYELQVQELPMGIGQNTLARLSDTFDDTWIDVGFWVQPDGRVSGLEIVRNSGRTGWARPLLRSIRGRIYSEAPEASYRLERYSYTADFDMVTGSRMLRRSPRARAEYFDLTERDPPPPAGR